MRFCLYSLGSLAPVPIIRNVHPSVAVGHTLNFSLSALSHSFQTSHTSDSRKSSDMCLLCATSVHKSDGETWACT